MVLVNEEVKTLKTKILGVPAVVLWWGAMNRKEKQSGVPSPFACSKKLDFENPIDVGISMGWWVY